MTAGLIVARDGCRRLYGKDYEELVAPLREMITVIMAKSRKNALDAMLELIERVENGGGELEESMSLMLIAAAVDIIEAEPAGHPP